MAYGSSPTSRRRRRTKAEMEAIREAIYSTLAEDHPQTVRGAFYQVSTAGVVPKTDDNAGYDTVQRLLVEMRRTGRVPYEWIADSTRWQRRPRTFSSVEEALKRTAETYRRSLWDDAPVAVEIWLEKEALAGVLIDVTHGWDVPLMVSRGYSSVSYLHSAATAIKARAEKGQRTHIYYFGDHDPSGKDIDRAIVHGIGESLEILEGYKLGGPYGVERTFGDYATFTRAAVTEEQIEEWDLPTRPTKKSDTRSKRFKGESVELDAIPAHQLKQLATEAIERHVDPHQLDVLERCEAEERRVMENIAATLGGAS